MLKICVVTVTYGNRLGYLSATLRRIIQMDKYVSSVVVVSNGSNCEISEMTKSISDKIVLLSLDKNMGSAGGYYEGIKYANDNILFDYYWLLDDDNLPRFDALENIIQAYQKLGSKNTYAFLSTRGDRPKFINASKSGVDIVLGRNNFLDFNIYNYLCRLILLGKRQEKKENVNREFVATEYAPYGGLCFPKSFVSTVGFPRKEFYLYMDDIEYSYRISKAGGIIVIVKNSNIDDLEKSFRVKSKEKNIYIDFEYPSKLVYLEIRNKVNFEYKNTVDNFVVYIFNLVIYVMYLALLLASRKHKIADKYCRYVLIIGAIKDGLISNFNKNENFINEASDK